MEGASAMRDDNPRLMLRNVKLQASKWHLRTFLEGIGLQPLEIQCCRIDRERLPRHQTVFVDLQSDTWLKQNFYNQKCYLSFHSFIHSFIHSTIHSFIHSFIHSITKIIWMPAMLITKVVFGCESRMK